MLIEGKITTVVERKNATDSFGRDGVSTQKESLTVEMWSVIKASASRKLALNYVLLRFVPLIAHRKLPDGDRKGDYLDCSHFRT